MKITYAFATGETVEIEVSEAIGEVIVEISEEEKRNDRTESRRHENHTATTHSVGGLIIAPPGHATSST